MRYSVHECMVHATIVYILHRHTFFTPTACSCSTAATQACYSFYCCQCWGGRLFATAPAAAAHFNGELKNTNIILNSVVESRNLSALLSGLINNALPVR